MSSETSNNDDKSYNKLTPVYTPVTETMHAITWDGNNATIMGTLLKIQEWVTRTQANSACSSNTARYASGATP